MKYREFAVSIEEYSDRLADLLRVAGIRFTQRPVDDPARKSVYVIRVHPADLDRANELHAQDVRRQRETFLRTLPFVRRRYSDKDMLETLEPNSAGYYASSVYHGEPFDPARYRLVRGGWDHEHCYLCRAKVLAGEEWWTSHPPKFQDEIGLCLDCYARQFGSN